MQRRYNEQERRKGFELWDAVVIDPEELLRIYEIVYKQH